MAYHQILYHGYPVWNHTHKSRSYFLVQDTGNVQTPEFHMYGVIGSAVVVGMISVLLIKKLNIKTIYGEKNSPDDKKFNKGTDYARLILVWVGHLQELFPNHYSHRLEPVQR